MRICRASYNLQTWWSSPICCWISWYTSESYGGVLLLRPSATETTTYTARFEKGKRRQIREFFVQRKVVGRRDVNVRLQRIISLENVMEQCYLLVDSLKDSRNPWEDVFSRHSAAGTIIYAQSVLIRTRKEKEERCWGTGREWQGQMSI